MPEMKYIGKAWLRGIPMRDLSAEEVEKYGGVEYLEKTGLYKAPKQRPKLVTEKEPEVIDNDSRS